jgi:hypothetical protein
VERDFVKHLAEAAAERKENYKREEHVELPRDPLFTPSEQS